MSCRLIYGGSGCRRSREQVIDSAPDKSCRKSRDEALRDGIERKRTMIDRGDAVRKLRAVNFGQLSADRERLHDGGIGARSERVEAKV